MGLFDKIKKLLKRKPKKRDAGFDSQLPWKVRGVKVKRAYRDKKRGNGHRK
jgi:hypothetical protein